MTLPLISIVIPVYNVALYIKECLVSVQKQTYKGPIECLIIDDCGSDNSVEIIEQFIKEYDGNIEFKLIHHEHNGGLSAARNTGIKNATGEYLYFLDSDDYIVPECIESFVECLNNNPGAQVVVAGALVTDPQYSWLNIENKGLPLFSNDPKWIASSFMERTKLSVTSWNKLIQRKLIVQENLYFKEGAIHEDEIYNVKLACSVSALAICNKNLYAYRIRTDSIIGKEESSNSRVVNYVSVIHEMCQCVNGPMASLVSSYLFIFIIIFLRNNQNCNLNESQIKLDIDNIIGKMTVPKRYVAKLFRFLCVSCGFNKIPMKIIRFSLM